MAQAFNENVGCGLIALAESEVQNEFRVALDCDEAVGIAKARIVARFTRLLFLCDEGPNFRRLERLSPEC